MKRAAPFLLTACLFINLISCGDTSGPDQIIDPAPSILSLVLQEDNQFPGNGTAEYLYMTNEHHSLSHSHSNSNSHLHSCGSGKSGYSVHAIWTQCPNDDFAGYTIYRSNSPGIAMNPGIADTCVVFTSVFETLWIDIDVQEGSSFYYILQTVNTDNRYSWSNEESVTIPSNNPPTPSIITSTYTGDMTWAQVTLEWTICPDSDFYSYVLYRSHTPGIENDPSSADTLRIVQGSGEVSFEDNDVTGSTTYYYAVQTWNQGQQSSWSNESSITTPEITPLMTVFFIDPSYGSYSGDAILLRTPDNGYYLIDGGQGMTGSWSCGEQKVLPLLDSLGVDSLDGMVGTHPHSDHIGGLVAVLEAIPVGTVWDSGWPYSASWIYIDYLEAIIENGADFVIPRRGDILQWGEDLTVECIHPVEPLSSGNMNNASITLRVTYDNVSFLFTGDLETSGGENVILDALSHGYIDDISADILKVGHHGSRTSTSLSWLQEVDPEYAAIEVGGGNPYGHPHDDVIERLDNYGVEILRTDIQGDFIIATDGFEIFIYP